MDRKVGEQASYVDHNMGGSSSVDRKVYVCVCVCVSGGGYNRTGSGGKLSKTGF